MIQKNEGITYPQERDESDGKLLSNCDQIAMRETALMSQFLVRYRWNCTAGYFSPLLS